MSRQFFGVFFCYQEIALREICKFVDDYLKKSSEFLIDGAIVFTFVMEFSIVDLREIPRFYHHFRFYFIQNVFFLMIASNDE